MCILPFKDRIHIYTHVDFISEHIYFTTTHGNLLHS